MLFRSGIIIYGILIEGIFIWFLQDKLIFTVSLFLGIITAEIMAIHMAWSLNMAFELDEGSATKQMQKYSMLRYGILVVLLGVILLLDIGNPVIVVVGVLGLKASAYSSPLTHISVRR